MHTIVYQTIPGYNMAGRIMFAFYTGPATRDDWGCCAQVTKKIAGNDESTLVLKLMVGTVIRSLKENVLVATQNGPWSNTNFEKKNAKSANLNQI